MQVELTTFASQYNSRIMRTLLAVFVLVELVPNGPGNEPESYFKTLFAATNLPNDLLVLVGLIGVGVAIWTLLTIKRQVNTFVSKERARITVDIEPLKPNGEEKNYGVLYDKSPMPPASGMIWYADLRIENSGETNAFIGVSLCKALIRGIRWDPRSEIITSQIGLPTVLRPHAEPFKHRARIETGQALRLEIDRETAQAIGNGSAGIYVIGRIEYRDVFDNQWAIKFCRVWGAWWFGGQWQNASVWNDYEPESSGDIPMNGELRVTRPSSLRRILRWIRRKKPDVPVIEIT